jgi:hypoxanthine phosphoribosyltransferase
MIINSKKFKKFISKNKIQNRISQIARQINKDYKNKRVLFLCVLDGSFMFASELYKKINLKSEISFVKIKSYKGTKSTNINDIIGLELDLKNKNVIIVEDIVDTGKTITYLLEKIKCKSIKVATLLSKPDVHSIKLNYIGFNISNKFVIGYGLDYNGLGRNLPEIYQIS